MILPDAQKKHAISEMNFLSLENESRNIGISADSVESHKKFAEKYKLPFNLLSDEKKEVVEKYGVWQEKVCMGKNIWEL